MRRINHSIRHGYVVKIQNGFSKKDAAVQSAKAPAKALLGATIIAVMAFYPIFASIESAGEYCRTLFIVVAISLMVSWLVSLTITPLQCMFMLKVEAKQNDKESKLLSLFRLLKQDSLDVKRHYSAHRFHRGYSKTQVVHAVE